MTQPVSPDQSGIPKKSSSIGQVGLKLFISAIGVVALAVIGYIGVNVVKNNGFLPLPSALDRYECTAGSVAFSFYYLHGTERVEIKSTGGSLQGTIRQNELVWPKFTQDRSLLGFMPPAAIAYENAHTFRLSGPDFSEALCVNTTDTSVRQRGRFP